MKRFVNVTKRRKAKESKNPFVNSLTGLDALGVMHIWIRAAACAGERIRICSDVHEWSTVRVLKIVSKVAREARVINCAFDLRVQPRVSCFILLCITTSATE